MLILELRELFDQVSFPCIYSELMIQCEKTVQPPHIIAELQERFSDYDDLIDYTSFEELENYDEEFFGQDD